MEFLNEKCRKTAQKTQNKIKYLYTETKICVIIILTKIITARGDNVIKKEMIAMLLAGGQGSRLGVLTKKVAKPAVSFGGKYRIIDFPLKRKKSTIERTVVSLCPTPTVSTKIVS